MGGDLPRSYAADDWTDWSFYSGAPDECGWHFRNGEIVRLDDMGECPRQSEHLAY